MRRYFGTNSDQNQECYNTEVDVVKIVTNQWLNSAIINNGNVISGRK